MRSIDTLAGNHHPKCDVKPGNRYVGKHDHAAVAEEFRQAQDT